MPVQIKRRVSVKRREVPAEPEMREKTKATTASKKTTLGTKRMTTQSKELKSRISLWDVESDNDRAPVARGTIQLTAEVVEELYELIQEGEEMVELGVSIWTTDSENEKAPSFNGVVKSPSERAAEIEAAKQSKNGGGKKSRRNSK